MATLGKGIELPAFSFVGPGKSAHELAYAKLVDESVAAKERGEIVGRLIQFQVADGYAVYRVEKTKPLTLAHVDFLDGYTISAAHIRGLRLADVKEKLDYADRLARFFDKQGK